MHWSSVDSRKK